MTAAGWVDLSNRRDTVDIDGLHIDLVGVDDPHLDRDIFPPAPERSVTDARTDEAPSGVRLGVVHAPYVRVLDQMHDDGADVILAATRTAASCASRSTGRS
ncbi:hypothetical protein NKG05_17435 [Oerskovia sp. M15]